MAAQQRYSVVITLPTNSAKFLKTERRARSTITVRMMGNIAEVRITAKDASALKASISAVVRDIAVIESVETAIKGRNGR